MSSSRLYIRTTHSKVNRFYLTKPAPISIVRDPATNRIVTAPCPIETSASDLYSTTKKDILACLNSAADIVHRDRLIYCIAGILFCHTIPEPFGGAKSCPGYWAYTGTTPRELLDFIVMAPYQAYWGWKGRFGIDAVVKSVNHALALHDPIGRNKSETDELVLRGMNRSGTGKLYAIPPHLQYSGEAPGEIIAVYFNARETQGQIDKGIDLN
ncbi:hypothetical protein HK100_012245 [Physocladia obscura]|uniref:Uncharacterized protein n=1 Tax=Physocladia obscura TaxID=109957 RepID=A0AAD5XHR4_9FUNG|nr:hypothetical protein HK100_012245 [Physocladia obscura]